MTTSRLVAALVLSVVASVACQATGDDEPAASAATYASSAPAAARRAVPATRAGGPGCKAKRNIEVCFSSPGTHGGTHPVVINRMRRLFKKSQAGDSLRIAMFRWDIPGAADNLVEAQARGVHVELVVDHDVIANAVGASLVQRIEAGDPAPGNTVVCDGACLPWTGAGPAPYAQDINHLKLIVADVGGERSVVTSSSNLAGLQYQQYNSLLRIVSPKYYKFADAWYDALKTQRVGTIKTTLANPPAMLYPRRGDILADTLRQVRCTPQLDQVDVHLAVIQRADIRSRLVQLSESGCRVRVVVDRPAVEKWLEQKVDGHRLPKALVRQVSTHDKGVIIHALVGGKPQYVVVTGTSNATCGGLYYNDEIMLRLKGKWIHDRYGKHFNDAFGHGRDSARGVRTPDFDPCT
ncbi:phospholipase D-like domain-containing protein [Nocardioides sp. InS609-2]|uniref:phospholipase D-like domain-containing protein n=1 Tax=Nocardioides sp. InS609-2 TaxID=2760705 RepID=UPI0020C0FBAD|nr:phospholipase D-like domain-containing protein [Nocardioides sp. InS609-2]